MYLKTMAWLQKIFGPFLTKHTFPDGSRISVMNRYVLRYEQGGRSVDVGFEIALLDGIDRLIHGESILKWNAPYADQSIDDRERRDILKKIEEYCQDKGLTSRLVGMK